MKAQGWVTNELRKQKRRKRCRYEREHTGSLIHADYHRTTEDSPHCIIWLDDASRKILAGGEFDSPNAAHALETFTLAEEHMRPYDCPIRQANTDRASAFVSNKKEG